jgi:hypothetical protein
MRLISLTTDFGTADWFVGTMKGVILRMAPSARVVDITHEIPAGNIRAGAFALASSCRFFPRHTIHVGVVDPGVGSARPGLVVETDEYVFVGPDNGLLSWAVARQKVHTVRRIENEKLFLKPVSRTFHGRDVFAPVAAYLCKGGSCRRLGPVERDWVKLGWPTARLREGWAEGEVIYVDRFGNAVTSLGKELIPKRRCAGVVRLPGGKRCPVREFYRAVPGGQAVAVWGSSGFLEIAVNGGNASGQLGLGVGSGVRLCPSPARERPETAGPDCTAPEPRGGKR